MLTHDEANTLLDSYVQSADGVRYLGHGHVITSSKLEPFPHGWVVLVTTDDIPGREPYMGQALHTIDTAENALLRFPQALPPNRILQDYAHFKESATRIDSPVISIDQPHKKE